MPPRSIAYVACSEIVGDTVAATPRSREYMVGSPLLAERATADMAPAACFLPDCLAALGR